MTPLLGFTNNDLAGCLIEGEALGIVEENFTQCGGTITITWMAPTGCDNNSVSLEEIITVEPAPEPVIQLPELGELTCSEAASFVAPEATFTNGESGACQVSGIAAATIESDFDECGGTVTLTYTAPTGCDNNSVEEVVVIDVAPAPVPVLSLIHI